MKLPLTDGGMRQRQVVRGRLIIEFAAIRRDFRQRGPDA